MLMMNVHAEGHLEGVEPTNNNAERPLRRAVLWRRIKGYRVLEAAYAKKAKPKSK